MARESLLSKPLFALAVFLLLGALMAVILFQRLDATDEAQHWVTHTHKVLQHASELNAALHEAESAQRGHIATGNEDFLKAYNRRTNGEEGSIDAEFAQLQTMVKDNHEQAARLDTLIDKIASKRAFMEKTIAVAREDKPQQLTKAQQMLHHGTGLELMKDIQDNLNAFRNREEELLKEREHRSDYYNRVNAYLMGGIGLVTVCLMVAAFMAIRAEMNRRLDTERRLRQTSSFQQALLDGASYAIIACDLDGTVVLFNPAAEQLTGYTAKEVVKLKTPAIWHVREEMEKRAAELSAQLGKPVQPNIEVFTSKPLLYGSEEHEWTFVRKDGSRVSVQLNVSALHDGDGNLSGYLGIATDISERKQIEQMKNEFISTVSHELRTPLTSIRGALGLISGSMAESIPENARNLVAIAHKNSERLVRLINNILDIEKIESGNIHFEHRALDIDLVVTNAVSEMTALAEKSNVKLVIERATHGAHIVGDEDRMLQVLGNLISNAIKFSPDNGTVYLSTERMGDGIRIAVRDQGAGVPEEFKSRIFSKFAQADSSDSRQKSGTGLGLSISKAITHSMGGTIDFESRPGNTVFFVTLPESQNGQRAEQHNYSADTVRLLIVEDDEDIATLLKMSLEQEGYACDIAETAARAHDMIEANKYFAVTMDLNLPDKDGLTLIRELRQKESTMDLPIVVISAQAEQGRKKLNGDAIGIIGWLPKPIDLDRLKRLLATLASGDKIPDIIYIEDEWDIIEVITASLEGVANIDPAGSLREARDKLKKRQYDLAILDIILPDGSGLDLLPELGNRPKPIPVIILSVAETSQEVQQKVMASMVKSVVTEDKVVATIKSLIHKKRSES